MILGRFFLLLLATFACLTLFAQTDKTLLLQYDSLEGWRMSKSNFEELINEYNKGGYDKFLNDTKKIKYPKLERVLGSEAIVLVSCNVYSDSFDFEFHNRVRKGFKVEIEEFLEKFLIQGWKEIPSEGLSMNLSFSFSFSNSKERNEGMVNIVQYNMANPSINKEGCNCACFDQNDKSLFKKAMNSSDKRVSLYFLREYLQRNPFSKNAHSMYQKLIEG